MTLLPASLPGRRGSGISPPCDWGRGHRGRRGSEGVKSISKEVRIVEEQKKGCRRWCWTQVYSTNDHHGLLCEHRGKKTVFTEATRPRSDIIIIQWRYVVLSSDVTLCCSPTVLLCCRLAGLWYCYGVYTVFFCRSSAVEQGLVCSSDVSEQLTFLRLENL